MKAIVAVDKNWGIGKNNDLLFSIPEDMKFFRDTTIGHSIVMGRKTFESLPKMLPERKHIVINKNINNELLLNVKETTKNENK